MSKKILISLGIIAAISALAIGGTIAYFSDTETSTGNTFMAGSIDLKIDNECYLNGELVEACTWELDDLTDQLFFDFEDLKPGDWGEDTVSLHVFHNDAWACVTFKNLESSDEDCVEPELEDEPGCVPDTGEGELAENLYFVFWVDDGDNIYEPEEEEVLMYGPASDILPGPTTYPIADATFSIAGAPGTPLTGSEDYYIGKYWCFGSWYGGFDVPSTEWTCDGSYVNNASQTDSLTGDIEFYAVQARNNPNFTCLPQ